MLEQIVFGVCMGVYCVIDIRTKKLPLWGISMGMFIILLLLFIEGRLFNIDRLAGMLVGGILLCISHISKGGIGSGDCLVLAVSGLVLGLAGNLVLIFISMAMTMPVTIYLLCVKSAGRKSELPFIPFLFLGYLFCINF